MAQKLAPYNNAMRLGQGFNSFTQQICINDAVVQPEGTSASSVDERQYDTTQSSDPTKVSQIVSYSSRFVDKLSDVTDAMNISASLSIKTSTIGGQASGSFIDSDKFKNSELNFYIQVKVVNQQTMAKDYTEFNVISDTMPSTKFTEVYGDSFISGWEEGGELNAIISVKVRDKAKTRHIKAMLEASLGTPALSGSLKGEADLENSNLESETETTITVNWSGGGQIKDANVIWDINSLTLAAANFPELVARTPQRTYAILTKYTALRSYYEKVGFASPLDYENAGIYASMLLDAYMDYKTIWKDIQVLNWEFERAICEIIPSTPPAGTTEFADAFVKKLASADFGHGKDELEKDGDQTTKPKFVPNMPRTTPYPASLVGLSMARKDARLEMIKIVHEVDMVTANPLIALDPARDYIFLSPSVFKKFIPVKKEAPKPVHLLKGEGIPLLLYRVGAPFPELNASALQYEHKSEHLQIGGWEGSASVPPRHSYFNDISYLDRSHRLIKLEIITDKTTIRGLKLLYSNGETVMHGHLPEKDQKTLPWNFAHDREEFVKTCKVTMRSTKNGGTILHSLCIASNLDVGVFTPIEPPTDAALKFGAFTPPPGADWDLAGFYGSVAPEGGFSSLGLIWGIVYKETIAKPIVPPLEGPTPENIAGSVKRHYPELTAVATDNASKAWNYRFSDWNGANEDTNVTHFNHLTSLDSTYRTKSMKLFFNDTFLVGLQIEYDNGKVFSHGATEHGTFKTFHSWSFRHSKNEVISLVHLRSERHNGDSEERRSIDCITIGSNYDLEEIHAWELKRPFNKTTTTMVAPTGEGWDLHGFYGSYRPNSGGFSRLGVIWGKY